MVGEREGKKGFRKERLFVLEKFNVISCPSTEDCFMESAWMSMEKGSL